MSTQQCYITSRPSGADILFGEEAETNVMYPLRRSRMLVFPLTPIVDFGGSAEYSEYTFAQSNYKYPSYERSAISEISIIAPFVAQTDREAKYLLAVMQFVKSASKSNFGTTDDRAGTPPPVMLFNYLGRHQFNNVPVVLKSYRYNLRNDIDYVYIEDFETYVPTKVEIEMIFEVYYNPKTLRDQFNLDDFRTGALYQRGFL